MLYQSTIARFCTDVKRSRLAMIISCWIYRAYERRSAVQAVDVRAHHHRREARGRRGGVGRKQWKACHEDDVMKLRKEAGLQLMRY